LDALQPRPDSVHIDGTFGGGGYTEAILERADCRVIGIDRDPDAIARGEALRGFYPGRLDLIEGRFGEMDALINEAVDGVVLDLGVSSFQLDQAERGFSFRFEAPLDMRMSRDGPTAGDAVNKLSETALADVLFFLGEESGARRIARILVEARARAPIQTTKALADLVERAVGPRHGSKIHPATQTFQALRLLVNNELEELTAGLAAAERILKPGGILAVVSFHSLEDRLVKTFFAERSGARDGGSRHMPEAPAGHPATFELTNRKGAGPSDAEAKANPRARSAHLRFAVRTGAPSRSRAAPTPLASRAVREWEMLAR
jgi:16S rRNA (cytosine1402-N4)-methyltransferase